MSTNTVQGSKALEMVMRDTLTGLEELANRAAFNPYPSYLQILSIEPPAQTPGEKADGEATVVTLKRCNAA